MKGGRIMRVIMTFVGLLCFGGCGSAIVAIGHVGANDVYLVKHGDFLSASRMLLVVDADGRVAAFAGGTVAGAGTLATQTAASAAMAGAVVYGASELAAAVQHISGTGTRRVKGAVNLIEPVRAR